RECAQGMPRTDAAQSCARPRGDRRSPSSSAERQAGPPDARSDGGAGTGVKIAVCSLSKFTYVAEFVGAAEILSQRHEVRYFLGFTSPAAVDLVERRGLQYEFLLDEPPAQMGPAEAASTHDLFAGYFFKQAELVLPRLPARLSAWGADAVLSHLRDFAGINAA